MNDSALLCQSFDAIGFDLDGVIYRGPLPVPGAPETLGELSRFGVPVSYVTNNAARPPQVVADQLASFGVACSAADVVTSAQATARLMASELPSGAEVLVVGSAALSDEIAAVGLKPTDHRGPQTSAVVVGFDPAMTWEQMNQGCYAVQQGAAYYACNSDMTRPTDGGLAIGMGGVLMAMGLVLNVAPVMGGKPARPLLDETRRRLHAEHPLFVGDRLDTDIEGAMVAGWASLFVLSGGHGPADLVAALPQCRPDFLASDIRGLLQPARVASFDGNGWHCGLIVASVGQAGAVIAGPLDSDEQRLDGLWALANLAWQRADQGAPIDVASAMESLTR